MVGAAPRCIEGHPSGSEETITRHRIVAAVDLHPQFHLFPFDDFGRHVDSHLIPINVEGCPYDLVLLWLEDELAALAQLEIVCLKVSLVDTRLHHLLLLGQLLLLLLSPVHLLLLLGALALLLAGLAEGEVQQDGDE